MIGPKDKRFKADLTGKTFGLWFVVGRCVVCNKAKLNLSLIEFKDWITKVYRRFHE